MRTVFGETTTAEIIFNTNGTEYRCKVQVEEINIETRFEHIRFESFVDTVEDLRSSSQIDVLQLRGRMMGVTPPSGDAPQRTVTELIRKVRRDAEFSKGE